LSEQGVPRRHLLVTNDFPPKVGGIQVYLWELWSRLDPRTTVVLTASSHPDHGQFDAEQAKKGLRIERVRGRILFFPTPSNLRRVRKLAAESGASLVIFDPAFPLGLLGPRLEIPYGVVLHGAEVSVPARLPVVRRALANVLQHASLVISAGEYPGSAGRLLVTDQAEHFVNIPPGVDCQRFSPLEPETRAKARERFGIPPTAPLVVSVSRLVPRKGMDVLIRAARLLVDTYPGLLVAIAGEGRDRKRLSRLIADIGAPVRLLGRISEHDKADLVGSADVFAMACRNRWGGLEQEGFGIVFLEAAAAGIPQVAGNSGGVSEVVVDGVTGRMVGDPKDPALVAKAIGDLLSKPELRQQMGADSCTRARAFFDYPALARRLAGELEKVGG